MLTLDVDTAIRRAIPPWSITTWRRDPAAGRSDAVGRHSSGTSADVLWATHADGVHLRRDFDDPPVVIGWPAIRRRIADMPDAAVDRLEAACRADSEHQATFVPFAVGPDLQGCGRAPEVGPPTARQAAYADAWDAWHRDHAEPYYARAAQLHAAVLAAFDDCLEPVDLVLFEAS